VTHYRVLPIRRSQGLALPVHDDTFVKIADRSPSVIVATAKPLRYRLATATHTISSPACHPSAGALLAPTPAFNPHNPNSSAAV